MTLEPLVLQNTKTGEIHRVTNASEFTKLTGQRQKYYHLMLFAGLKSMNEWDNLKLSAHLNKDEE